MTYDDRLLDLARRMLSGEAIDWAQEGVEESEVREGMQRLARIIGRPGVPTETKAAPAPEPPPPPPPPPPPRRREDRFIGDFRLVRQLGEGGMGVVYEAEQQHPRRPVALKVIRGGAHVSPETLKLFQREAATLARLRHPGIAALYETGATEEGLHFFAMELVRGSTLTAWLGQRPAGPITPHELRLRLSIFKKICDAVAYAHQKGVIHRDLKPANVLIPKPIAGSSMPDEVPEVKVLDFGLARITDSDVQATTYVTEMGQIRGTLPYMSPEQVRGNPDEIDLRTDVYALGVMLYEMVTGSLPYDISKAQIPEAVRIICEQAPKSISTSFTGTRHLDADLITIAGKCLEKETSRRYQSAAAFGEDIQRYLSDQPILARPPSAMYQFRKLAARHKGAVAFGATVFVLVTVLAVTSTIQAVRIAKERDRANQEAETAKQVSDFLEGLFKVSDPSEARGNEIKAREILDRGAEKIERELRSEPQSRARLMAVIGRVYWSLGLTEPAERLLTSAVRIREESGRGNDLETADSLNALGQMMLARGDIRRSLDFAARANTMRERLLPSGDPGLALGIYNLAVVSMASGDFRVARHRYESALKLVEGHAELDLLRIWIYNDLGLLEQADGRYSQGREWLERAEALGRRALSEDDPERLARANGLGFAFVLEGQLDEARRYLEPAAAGIERVYGPKHRLTAAALHSIGELERRAGHYTRAYEYLQRAIAAAQSGGDPAPSAIAPMLFSLAQLATDEGKLAEAERRYTEILAERERSLGRDSPAVAEALEELADVLRSAGQDDRASRAASRAREIRAKSGTIPGTHNYTDFWPSGAGRDETTPVSRP